MPGEHILNYKFVILFGFLLVLITGNCLGRASAAKTNLQNDGNQYYIEIFTYLQPRWILPEDKEWDPNLAVTITLIIKRSGDVRNILIEKSSGNYEFDFIAFQTVDKATPFPPIPDDFKRDEIEIGLHFKPGAVR